MTIRPARRGELREGAALLAGALGFPAAEAIPAWLMQLTGAAGGLALVAREDDRCVGFSYAFPGVEPAGPFLFSCGLAVAEDRHGCGIGRALKLAQREHALALGYRIIRWTADPLNAPALRLYLNRLGARVVGYEAGLHDGVRLAGVLPQDDVRIEWRIAAAEPPIGAGEPPIGAGEPPIGDAAPAVELPDAPPIPEDGLAWRLRVREHVTRALADGWIGVRVANDHGRCRLVFGAPR